MSTIYKQLNVILDQRTGVSDNTEKLLITPEHTKTSSLVEKRLARGGKDLNKAAEFAGIIKKSRNMPTSVVNYMKIHSIISVKIFLAEP